MIIIITGTEQTVMVQLLTKNLVPVNYGNQALIFTKIRGCRLCSKPRFNTLPHWKYTEKHGAQSSYPLSNENLDF